MALKRGIRSPYASPAQLSLQALDAVDRAILRIVQRDNKTPQRTIAKAVHLSPAAAQHYRQSSAILEPLTADHPGNVETLFDLERVRQSLRDVAPVNAGITVSSGGTIPCTPVMATVLDSCHLTPQPAFGDAPLAVGSAK